MTEGCGTIVGKAQETTLSGSTRTGTMQCYAPAPSLRQQTLADQSASLRLPGASGIVADASLYIQQNLRPSHKPGSQATSGLSES